MARKKVNLAYIAHDAVRRATFKRRCRGLLKKVNELSVLCDVKACAVIYAPGEAQPAEAWPNGPEARRMVEDFRSLPELEQSKRMTSQAAFLHQRAAKMSENYGRAYRGVHDLEMTVMMYEGLSGCASNLEIGKATELSYFVETKLKEVRKKIALAKEAADAAEAAEKEREKMDGVLIEELRKQNWFAEMGPTGTGTGTGTTTTPPHHEPVMYGQFGGPSDNGIGSGFAVMPDSPYFFGNN